MKSLSPKRTRANEVKRRLYAKEAANYDKEADFSERWLFGTDHRGWACSRAIGDTLEVAIGTGLNLPYYPADVRLHGLDLSPEMLAIAKSRAKTLGRTIKLMEGDAQDLPLADRQILRHGRLHIPAVQRPGRCQGHRRDESGPQAGRSPHTRRPHPKLGQTDLLAAMALRIHPTANQGGVFDSTTRPPRDGCRPPDRGARSTESGDHRAPDRGEA